VHQLPCLSSSIRTAGSVHSLGNWLFRSAPLPGIYGFLTGALHAVVAWFLVCAPTGLLLYVVVFTVLRRWQRIMKIAHNA
jgi:hypothetical protein